MIIRTVEMENFKMFKKFSMAGDSEFKRFTLVGGGNNVGKTSLLEGLILGCDGASASIYEFLKKIRRLQKIKNTPLSLWKPLYHKNNTINNINININNNDISISIHPYKYFKEKEYIRFYEEQQNENFYPLTVSFKHQNNQRDYTIHINKRENLEDNTLGTTFWGKDLPPFKEFLPFFLNLLDEHTLHHWLSNVKLLPQQEEPVLEFINNLYPNTEKCIGLDVIIENNIPIVYAQLETGFSHPISLFGEGISRLLSIILGMYSSSYTNTLILIDEFESGLHYSILPKVMEEFAKLAQKFNQQIIATTHSYECLQAVVTGLADNKNLQDDFAYVRLGRVPNEEAHIVAKSYDYDALKRVTDKEWEIR